MSADTPRGSAAQKNPQGIHTECGPLNAAGQPLHLHIWPMNADHTKRWRPVEYVGRHRANVNR